MKDHTTSVEEALKLVSALFLVVPNSMTIMGPNQMILQHSRLSFNEIQLLNTFWSMLNFSADNTYEDRINRAVKELSKIVHSGAPGENEQ